MQLGEGAPQTGGERGARGDRGQLDPTAGEVGADGGAAPFGQRDPALTAGTGMVRRRLSRASSAADCSRPAEAAGVRGQRMTQRRCSWSWTKATS
ncbi:hypothetical protein B277_15902 [Janibacter hoylei PVAS-1]|uniref:Uncharacterized protein n=1 Tax=Janibacter hoylei PVAS-1 TaxID=1210046 RepID=K1DU21_9MICO|nr:hypothetical protein B277_15902 [Janibacter hoylei PVAS-1]